MLHWHLKEGWFGNWNELYWWIGTTCSTTSVCVCNSCLCILHLMDWSPISPTWMRLPMIDHCSKLTKKSFQSLVDVISDVWPPLMNRLAYEYDLPCNKLTKYSFQSLLGVISTGCLTPPWWSRRTATPLGAGPPPRTEAPLPQRARQSGSRSRTVWTRTW